MAKLSSFKADVDREQEGVWQEYAEGIEFRIGRLGNPKYQSYAHSLAAKHKTRNRNRRIDIGKADELAARAMAKHIVLDWRNIEDDEGREIPYSEAKAFEILTDPTYHELRAWIEETAQDAELFRAEQIEDAAGNSEPASAGS